MNPSAQPQITVSVSDAPLAEFDITGVDLCEIRQSHTRAQQVAKTKGLIRKEEVEAIRKIANHHEIPEDTLFEKVISRDGGVIRIDFKGLGLRTLSWFGAFTSLVQLELGGNQLTSMRGIAGLTHLKYLNLSRNRLTNLDYFPRSPELVELFLSKNQIESVNGIEFYTALRRLYIGDNPIKDYSPLKELPSLTTLSASKISTGK